MGILLAFAPFFVFVIVERIWGIAPGLAAAAVVAAGLLVRDWVTPNRTVKILEIGTMLLFGGLAIYARLTGTIWSVIGVRLRVDVGLLLIVLASICIAKPFTLQYAREGAPRELWDKPEFIRANYLITAVWAAAFLVIVLADVVAIYVPAFTLRAAIIVSILALVGAAKFTAAYTEQPPAEAAKS